VMFNPKTTTWQASYDGRTKEPVTLPAKFPIVLLEGADGIAVGLSTKILPHNFNDLTLDRNGDVFFSDAASGEIDVVRAGSAQPEPFIAKGTFVSPQGLVLDRATNSLYVADYARGLARVDLEKRQVTFFEPDGATLVGIDGLVQAGRQLLLAVQNGIAPARVVAFQLSPDGLRIEARRVLERAHPEHAEPTLGVLIGDSFYYVANAQWDAFATGAPHLSPRKPPTVLKMPVVP